MWETRVRSLGQEDPLEKGMATYSIILAWRIPGTEEPGGLKSMGSKRVEYNSVTKQQQKYGLAQTLCLAVSPCALGTILDSKA